MTKFGRTASDSLDLLLDTMCSMFGAIILIAILVALMTQTSRSPVSVRKDDADLLRRKIQIADADIAAAQQIIEAAAAVDPAIAALISEQRRLEKEIEAARNQGAAAKNEISHSTAETDFSSKSKALSASLMALQRDSATSHNTLKAQTENIDRLQQRLNSLQQQIAQTKTQHQVKLRFPKEHETAKDTVPIILKYDSVYPTVQGSPLLPNKDNIDWRDELLSEGHEAIPIRGKGYAPSSLISVLQALNRDTNYLVLYVCDDSFDCFEKIKSLVANAGFDFGWEPISPSEHLRFGKHGHSPPAL